MSGASGITIRFHVEHLNKSKPTIYQVLKQKLGREPLHSELTDECRRILAEARAAT